MADVSRRIRITVALLSGLLLYGCNEAQKAERPFTDQHNQRTFAHSASDDPYDGSRPFVISPNVNDAHASRAADEALDAADWQALEQLAPKQEWEGVFAKQKQYAAEHPNRPNATATGDDRGRIARAITTVPRTPPTVTKLDGKVQIYYRLWHYGGANVDTGRKTLYDKPAITTKDSTLEPLVKIVQNHLGAGGTVEALPSENMLVITCAPEEQTGVLDLLKNIDTARQQVEITVRIFEVSDNFDLQLGVRTLLNHLSGTNSQGFLGNFDAADFAGQALDPMNAVGPNPGSVLKLVNMFQRAGVGVDITFQALEETGLVKVVSAPRMTVAAGEPAFMMAGQELPIHEGQLANDKFVTEKISYKPIGVQLYITPQTIGDRSTKLHILTVVSAISGFAPLPTIDGYVNNTGIVNPILDSRQAETRVEVPHGSTLVFGGLRMVRRVAMEDKVPLVGDVPVFGWLFKNKREQKQLSDLYFFVTPRLVQ